MKSFDYVRKMVSIKQPLTAMVALDVRMGPFESDDIDVIADTTAIFLMLDSPLLTIQAIIPYSRADGSIAFSRGQITEVLGNSADSPCLLLKLFSAAPVGIS
jgi:hypothetical protein